MAPAFVRPRPWPRPASEPGTPVALPAVTGAGAPRSRRRETDQPTPPQPEITTEDPRAATDRPARARRHERPRARLREPLRLRPRRAAVAARPRGAHTAPPRRRAHRARALRGERADDPRDPRRAPARRRHRPVLLLGARVPRRLPL